MRASSLVLLLATALTGCATATSASYVYRPAVQVDARANGYPAAYYSIPFERPVGDVRVGSFGLSAVQPQGGGPTTRVAHVRLIVANNADDVPWTVDTRDAVLSIPGEGSSRPAFVNTDAGVPPVVQIVRGDQRTIDLYYPLPAGRAAEEALPAFDVTWKVRTATGDTVQRTPFERDLVDGDDADYAGYYGYPYGYYGFGLGYALGFGTHWWYDGYYSSFGFHHAPAFVVGHGHLPYQRLHVTRPHGSFGHYGRGHYSGGHHSGGHGGGGHGGGGH